MGGLHQEMFDAREARRQHPPARRLVGMVTAYVVGNGITLRSGYAPLQRFIDEFWQRNLIERIEWGEGDYEAELAYKEVQAVGKKEERWWVSPLHPAAARPLPGARPYPLRAVDYGYAASNGTLAAMAEGQGLLFGLPIGSIESTANLGVELYDVVTVEQTRARVVGITETFERGRLRQRVTPAEVDGFGVDVG